MIEISDEEVQTFLRRLKTVCASFSAGLEEEAVSQAEHMLRDYPCSVPVLSTTASILQLANRCMVPLENIKQLVRAAWALDSDNLDCLYELAWFTYAVEDDPRSALSDFDKLCELTAVAFRRALVGKARCLDSLGEHGAALGTLRDYLDHFTEDEEYRQLYDELIRNAE